MHYSGYVSAETSNFVNMKQERFVCQLFVDSSTECESACMPPDDPKDPCLQGKFVCTRDDGSCGKFIGVRHTEHRLPIFQASHLSIRTCTSSPQIPNADACRY